MFSRCIFCHAPFPENQSLEHLRHGRRIAFDPARGRLWTVCGACSRWTLAPIEERWEALEELDRLATDRARLLSSTENVALMRVEDLEIVRVGRPGRTEEAWWRYGRELTGRRRRSNVLRGLEVAAVVGASVATGGMFGAWFGHGVLVEAARWHRFGNVATRARVECPRCGSLAPEVRFRKMKEMVLVPGDDGGVGLFRPCHCGRPDSGFLLTGAVADHALRRILARRHFSGASENRIREATRAIEHAGSAQQLARKVTERRPTMEEMGRMDRTRSVALEIAVNDETERRLLEMELWELERRWKEEEEIAAIVDRELSFVPGLDRLLGKLGGRGPAS
jgi:hypothetical protein